MKRKLRFGMIGGGRGAFIGAVHVKGVLHSSQISLGEANDLNIRIYGTERSWGGVGSIRMN